LKPVIESAVLKIKKKWFAHATFFVFSHLRVDASKLLIKNEKK